MHDFSFQFSTDYSSNCDRGSMQRQAELDRITFERMRQQFKDMAAPAFGRKLKLYDPFS